MAGVNTAPPKLSKKRKLGKNKKKSWRVAKVEDVEEFLDDERRQILTGGLVSEKANDSLFVIDKSSKKDVQPVESKSKRNFRNRPLKCIALLQPDPHSKVVRKPDPVTFKKGKRTQSATDFKNQLMNSKTRMQALEQRKQWEEEKGKKQAIKRKLPVVDEDLWSGDTEGSNPSKVKRPKSARRQPSALPATPLPHPGTSVNPAFEDHQDLLLQAHLREAEKRKKEKKIHNALDAKFPSQTDAPNKSTFLVEMSAGLFNDLENESDEDGCTKDIISANPPVRREDRKTKKQKRLEKELAKQVKQKIMEESLKKRENMVLRLPTLKSEINKEERLRKERESLKKKQKEEEKFKTKRLSQIKYPFICIAVFILSVLVVF
ncbi:hypothetical protein Btru_046773 [Bulinus truncatus]|nr:hypothetical protein Btru_046773 [Bulinus truncatus]